MVPRINANNFLIAAVVVVLAAVAEGRLQGGAAGTTRATGATHASTQMRGIANKINNQKQLRTPARKLIEKEEEEILAKMEKEYQSEQASRQKVPEHAIKSRSKIFPDAELLQNLRALDALFHRGELQHQEGAKEEKKQAEAKKPEQQSLADVELEKLIQKQKEESTKYEAKMKLKKAYAALDRKAIASAKKAARFHQKAQEDLAKQMHQHTHKNDEKAVKDDEKRIKDMVLEEQKIKEEARKEKMNDEKQIMEMALEEQKIQEEARKEKIEYEQKLQQQYERQNELEQRTLKLLIS